MHRCTHWYSEKFFWYITYLLTEFYIDIDVSMFYVPIHIEHSHISLFGVQDYDTMLEEKKCDHVWELNPIEPHWTKLNHYHDAHYISIFQSYSFHFILTWL